MGTITRGKIQRGDLANWDGKTPTATRPDATSGTVTGLVIGNEVDVAQVYGDGSRTLGAISAAVQKIAGTNVTLVFAPGTWTIDDDLTIPSNFTCHIPAGCVFDVSAGKTLTINGHVQAGLYHVFSGAGTVTGFGKNTYIYPNWWGATGDNSTDDQAAIQSTVVAAGNDGVVTFTPGNTYVINSGITVPYDNHTWIMHGATIRVNFNGLGLLFGETGVRHFYIRVYGGTVERLANSAADYTAGNIGVQFLNCRTCLYSDFVITGFEKGLFLKADSGEGTTYFNGTPVNILNSKYAIYLETDGSGSFVNENCFVGSGSIGYTTNSPDGSGAYAIYLDAINGGDDPNNNKFFGTSLEQSNVAAGKHDGAIFNNGAFNQFYGLRYEGWDDPFIDGGSSTVYAVYSHGFGLTGVSNVNIANHGHDFIMDARRTCYRGAGDGSAAAFTLREANTNANVAFRIENTGGDTVFEIGSTGGVKIGSNGSEVTQYKTSTVTWDPASIADGEQTSTTVGITCALGDTVAVGFTTAVPAGVVLTGAITADGTVTVTLLNESGNTQDLDSGTLRASVWRH
jgi:hypothetical protein